MESSICPLSVGVTIINLTELPITFNQIVIFSQHICRAPALPALETDRSYFVHDSIAMNLFGMSQKSPIHIYIYMKSIIFLFVLFLTMK